MLGIIVLAARGDDFQGRTSGWMAQGRLSVCLNTWSRSWSHQRWPAVWLHTSKFHPTHGVWGGGCLCLYFSFLGVFLFLKHFLLWHSSWTVDSSVNITSSKASFSSILLLHQSNLFNLLAYRIAWQYLAVAKVQPSSFLSLAIALIPYCTLSEPNLLTRMSFRSVAVNSSFSAMGSSIQL